MCFILYFFLDITTWIYYTSRVITQKVEHLIKIGYLKWKSPTEIANGITILLQVSIKPLDVHNFIQGKHQEWSKYKVFCRKCNVDIVKHKRCPLCTRLIHENDFCCLTILKDL